MKVGDYVRTINGKIWIINSQQAISGHKKDIINASFNIIDLIEVGDYVNEEKVRYIKKGKDWCYLSIDDECDYIIAGYDSDGWAKPIKSIVTKEQFESMEYKVGE